MNKTFVISDTHLYHDNILKYDKRPFETLEDMTTAVIENWNSVVSDEDTVYVLGDFMLGDNIEDNLKRVVTQLNGRKILIKGNHDYKNNKMYYDAGFDTVEDNPIIVMGYIILSHRPMPVSNSLSYVNIFGHMHLDARYSPKRNKFCACVGRKEMGYTPILLETALKIMKRAPMEEG